MEADIGSTDAYHQSVETVEETLSKLRETACGWPTTLNSDFEHQTSLIIEHLEQMLSHLKAGTEDNGEEDEEGIQEIEGNELPDSGEHSEVCRLKLNSLAR
jgi:hypothetical protein